jgi:hypothetical protein
MAEIIELCRPCVPVERVSFFGWLVGRLRRPPRPPNADDLPDRLRQDMGLPDQAPTESYRDYPPPSGR